MKRETKSKVEEVSPVEDLAKSIGIEHRLNARNAPTVLNAAPNLKPTGSATVRT